MENIENQKKPSKIKLVISDFHIGDGHKVGYYNIYDDFFFDEEFYEFMEYYSTNQYENMDVELIINGDFYDLLKVRYNDQFSDIITPIVGMNKLQKCFLGHPLVLKALKLFISKNRHTITYIFGNHDMEIVFPEVQDLFKSRIAAPSDQNKIKFIVESDLYLLPGGIQIHHGHQFEIANCLNYKMLMLVKNLPEPILNLPWGSYFVLHVLTSAIKDRPYIDHVKPFPLFLFLSLIFDFRCAVKILAKAFYYFFKTRFIRTPTRRSRFTRTIQIILHSIAIFPSLEEHALKILRKVHGINCVIFGHSHNYKVRTFANDKLYINTGSWIKIVNLDFENLGPRLKMTYALIQYYKDEKDVSVNLYEWLGSRAMIRKVIY